MAESQNVRSLRLPVVASVGLLVAGVSALVVRAEVLQWGWYWDQYRNNVRYQAQFVAREAAKHLSLPAPFAGPPPRPVLTVSWVLGVAKVPALSVVVIGVMAMLLIANGRRLVWLPLAAAATMLNDPGTVINGYGGWTTFVGRATGVVVIAASAVPLLVATRRKVRVARRVPRPVLVAATVAVAVPALVLYAGPNNSDVPNPAAAVAVLLYGALIAGSSLSRRWLPAALAVPVLALPGVAWAVGDTSPGNEAHDTYLLLGVLAYASLMAALRPSRRWLPLVAVAPLLAYPPLVGGLIDTLNGNGPSLPSFTDALLLTLGLVAFGAAVPLSGPQLLAWWAKATHRGPIIGPHRTAPATS